MADTNRLILRQALADTLEAAYKVSYHAGQPVRTWHTSAHLALRAQRSLGPVEGMPLIRHQMFVM